MWESEVGTVKLQLKLNRNDYFCKAISSLCGVRFVPKHPPRPPIRDPMEDFWSLTPGVERKINSKRSRKEKDEEGYPQTNKQTNSDEKERLRQRDIVEDRKGSVDWVDRQFLVDRPFRERKTLCRGVREKWKEEKIPKSKLRHPRDKTKR